MAGSSPPRAAYAAWGGICFVWGTSYLAIKIALETVPPLMITGLRYGVAGAVLLVWLAVRRQPLPAARQWPGLAAIGVLMLAVGNGFLVYAEQHVPSGLAAVLLATTPFWMAGIDVWTRPGESLSGRQVAGLLLGFAGILLLVWPDLFSAQGFSWAYALGVIGLQLACAGWAFGSFIGRRQALAVAPVQAAAAQMLAAGAVVLLLATVTGQAGALRFTARSATALGYLTVFASLAAFVAYTFALTHLPMSFVSLYAYVNPVVAVALGALFAGEPFNARIAAAMAIILASTALASSAVRAT
jgi:drug/metabolite transporter (DMT)-like permease